MRFCRFLIPLILSILICEAARAFSLIGSYESPNPTTNCPSFDIGRPVKIGEGYRWNVPVITYAYDQSFVSFFGNNGVAAVESVIQILNDLPPASTMNPYDFPTNALTYVGYLTPQILDLKSAALGLLLRQIGLAAPERYVFYVQSDPFSTNATNFDVVVRNFDPFTLQPSTNINGVSYTYKTHSSPQGGIETRPVQFLDSNDLNFSAVGFANFLCPDYGLAGLSRDDAGALQYLLGTNNLAMEGLISGVTGTGTNASNYVNFALRPGIDKITFQRVQVDSILGELMPPLTNQYVDCFVIGGVVQHQNLQRVIAQPDIIFSAATFTSNSNFSMTPASGWSNNATDGKAGPGVIQPPIKITFGQRPTWHYRNPSSVSGTPQVNVESRWGSFDMTTNGAQFEAGNLVVYHSEPGSAAATIFNLDFLSSIGGATHLIPFSWRLPGYPGSQYLLQGSSNLIDWETITPLTNTGWSITYSDVISNIPASYLRTIPH